MKSIPIGQLLLKKEYITEEQLQLALKYQRENKGKRLGDVIVELGFISEIDKLTALGERLNVAIIKDSHIEVSNEIIKLINENIVKKYEVMPIKIDNNSLIIATSDPLDFYALEDLKGACGLPISPVLAPKSVIASAINKYYVEATIGSVITKINETFENEKVLNSFDNLKDVNSKLDNAPIVKFIDNMIHSAYEQGVSDIHIEPLDKETIIRFRIDGLLRKENKLHRSAHESLINRLKIMSGMDIAERRIPQDGRILMKDLELDLRLSSVPTVKGEKIVIRLLGDGVNKLTKLADLKLNNHDLKEIEKLLQSPNGVILVTGPTGSGKSTTLYSMLDRLQNPTMNIITVEDPVERKIEGINQIQVNAKAGLTFASGLRAILRQDPDVIMIGEIRDEETAQIAVRASITGHLVLSTIHTNDTASTIVRLIDMGIPNYLVSSSVTGIIAQRLTKLLCNECKEEVEANEYEKHLLKLPPESKHKIYKPKGCAHCVETGYKGRKSVLEIMPVNSTIKNMISTNKHSQDIKATAVEEGMLTLEYNMIQLVKDGITSIDELIKIAHTSN